MVETSRDETEAAPPKEPILFSFSIGPVQPFIASARSLRDLFSGSRILSWLTVCAMDPILKACGRTAFVLPDLTQCLTDQITAESLPNRFIARCQCTRQDASRLRAEVLRAAEQAWTKMSQGVLQRLRKEWDPSHPGWSTGWDEQASSFFEMRCLVVPAADIPKDTCLGSDSGMGGDMPGTEESCRREIEYLGRLMDSIRSIRHVPVFLGASRPKCTLMGSYEQLSPQSNGFSLQGIHLRENERFSALALVKRFAPLELPQAGLGGASARFPDTASIAAATYIHEADLEQCSESSGWSGQWLHWREIEGRNSQDSPSDRIWSAIVAARKAHGRPPTYYAILLFDGDSMGKWLRGALPVDGRALPLGTISSALAVYSREVVPAIVKNHLGACVYAGGDDLLALVPLSSALKCSLELRQAFSHGYPAARFEGLHSEATVSGAVCVVHYKEDLRVALAQARRGEHLAKQRGRNACALMACRRSGEWAVAVSPWQLVESFLIPLQAGFGQGASSGWTNKIRAELPALSALPPEAFAGELQRVIRRGAGDGASAESVEAMAALVAKGWGTFLELTPRSGEPDSESWVCAEFVTLCQSVEFINRGRDRDSN